MHDQENLLNIRQACKILNVHPMTLRRWEKDGKIHPIRIGTRQDRRYRVEDIYSMVNTTTPKPTEEDINGAVWEQSEFEKTITSIEESKCVLFDFADTLMMPFPSRGGIYAEVALKYGYNLDPNKLEQSHKILYGEWEKEKLLSEFTIFASQKVREDLYTKLNSDICIKAGIPESKQFDALQIGREIYHIITSEPKYWQAVPGAIEFVDSLLNKGKVLGVVDNWNSMLHGFIENSPFKGKFKFVLSGGELKMRKPNKILFEKALEMANAEPSETRYIGDRYIDDVIGPQNAKIIPIMYDYERKYLKADFLRIYSFRQMVR